METKQMTMQETQALPTQEKEVLHTVGFAEPFTSKTGRQCYSLFIQNKELIAYRDNYAVNSNGFVVMYNQKKVGVLWVNPKCIKIKIGKTKEYVGFKLRTSRNCWRIMAK